MKYSIVFFCPNDQKFQGCAEMRIILPVKDILKVI